MSLVRAKQSTQFQRFYWQSALNLIGNAVASFLAFLFNFLVVQNVTQADYGEYSSVMSYVTLLSLPLTVVALLITKKISARPESGRRDYLCRLNSRILATLRSWWWLVVLGLLAIVWWLCQHANFLYPTSVILVLVLLVANCVTTFLSAQITGLQWFGVLSLVSVVSMLFRLLGGALALHFAASLASLYVSLGVTMWLQTGLHVWGLCRRGQTLTSNNRALPYLWSQLATARDWWLTLTAVTVTTALLNVDVITVKMLCPALLAGQYGLYSLLAKVIVYASQPLINVAFTFFNSHESVTLKRRIYWLSVGLIVLFTAGMSLIYRLIPEFLIVYVGTQEYLALAPILWLAAIFGGLYCLCMLTLQNFLARERAGLFIGLLAPVIQIVGIACWHTSALAVMLVNIVVVSVLLVVLGLTNLSQGRYVA